jgi:ABC-2 type transport system ATP-binding protein
LAGALILGLGALAGFRYYCPARRLWKGVVPEASSNRAARSSRTSRSMPNRSAVFLLDEQTAGVDPLSRRDFWRILYGLRGEGVAIVIATSYLDEPERCTRLGLLRQGRMAYCDAPEALKRLMPGEIIAIATQAPREARGLVAGLEGVKGAILTGDSVHVVVDDAGLRSGELKAALGRTGVAIDGMERIAPSIEDLFVSLLMTESEG